MAITPMSTAMARASALLKELEAQKARGQGPQLSLFAGGRQQVPETEPVQPADALRGELALVDPDSLTPKDALSLVYRLKELVDP